MHKVSAYSCIYVCIYFALGLRSKPPHFKRIQYRSHRRELTLSHSSFISSASWVRNASNLGYSAGKQGAAYERSCVKNMCADSCTSTVNKHGCKHTSSKTCTNNAHINTRTGVTIHKTTQSCMPVPRTPLELTHQLRDVCSNQKGSFGVDRDGRGGHSRTAQYRRDDAKMRLVGAHL